MSAAFRRRHHGRLLRLLRWSLIAGAAYDFLFAVLMLAAPELPERMLGLPRPGEPFYLWLIAVFLFILGAVYLLAAYDPISYRGVIPLAIVGRTAGAAVLAAGAFGRPDLAGLYVLAAGDLSFAVAHTAGWLPIRHR